MVWELVLEEQEKLMAAIAARHRGLSGVIHGAGNLYPGRLSSKSREAFTHTIGPKLRGVRLLLDGLARHGLHPPFFVGFSSMSAVIPGWGRGLADYVAANAGMDAFASIPNTARTRFISINWSIWAGAGRGAEKAVLDHLERKGLRAIEPETGYGLLQLAIGSGMPQILAVHPELAETWRERSEFPAVAGPPIQASSSTSRLQPGKRQSNGSLIGLLAGLLADHLNIDSSELSHHESFERLGLDSMDALDLVSVLEAKGFQRLPATLFFEHNTISKLAAHLESLDVSPSVAQGKKTAAPSAEEGVLFGLSHVQAAFFASDRLRPREVAYSFLRQTLVGPLDMGKLQAAVDGLVARHGMLRAQFDMPPGCRAPMQQILPIGRASTPRVKHFGTADSIEGLEDRIVNQPMSLERGQVLRIAVALNPKAGAWHLLVCAHHIVADGWSLNLLVQELWRRYGRELGCDWKPGRAAGQSFREYLRFRESKTAAAEHGDNLSWWKKYLRSFPARYEPLFDREPEPDKGPRQRAHRQACGQSMSRELGQLARKAGVSLFHLLLAMYFRCLARWSSREEWVIGVAEARRDEHFADMARMIGSFAEVFPMKLALSPNEPPLETAIRVRDAWREIHAQTRISSIELTRLMRSSTHGRGVRIASFSFARFPASLPDGAPFEIKEGIARTATPSTVLTLLCYEFNGRLHFTWNYPAALFKHRTIAGLANFFWDELTELKAANPESNALPPAVRASHVCSFLGDIQTRWRFHSRRIAIVDGRNHMSFSSLRAKTAYWMKALAQQGVRRNDAVGFLGETSAEAIVLLLAVLRLGATWLPLDPRHPVRRINLQMRMASAKLLAFPMGYSLPENVSPDYPRLPVDLAWERRRVPPPVPVAEEDIAFIIFTSGTTGEPNAVPIRYRSLDDYLRWAVQTFGYSPGDRVLQATSLGFDASLRQCLAPLMAGASVHPPGRERLRDSGALLRWLRSETITVWSSVPSLWLQLLCHMKSLAARGKRPQLPHLRLLQLGGESLAAAPVRRWFDLMGGKARVVNLYGPAEATINATYYALPGCPDDSVTEIPIGYALPGRRLQVVNRAGRRVKAGQSGELWIGGSCLSPGYLNPHPNARQKFGLDRDKRPVFKSGDLVRQNEDGTLIFVGRCDRQVKIRGYRIELEEIEHALLAYPGMVQAAVAVRPESGRGANHQALIAFLELGKGEASQADLRRHLGERLPHYMVPHHFEMVPELPLRPNGKVDRDALAKLVEKGRTPIPEASGGMTPPLSVAERDLAAIWREILGGDRVLREDDFFSLGGDSLKMLAVLSDLEAKGWTVSNGNELYRNPILMDQARVIYRVDPAPKCSMAVQEDEAGGAFPLSPAQTGFLLMRSFSPPLGSTWSACFYVEGRLDPWIFERAIAYLIRRHPMLRTLCPSKGKPYLQVETVPDRPFSIQVLEFDRRVGFESTIPCLQRENETVFDLRVWPLVKIRLLRIAADRHIWQIVADHFVGDGYSGWLFGAELLSAYDAMLEKRPVELPAPRSSFRDYVVLSLERERVIPRDTRRYWRRMFHKPYRAPVDWKAPAENDFMGESWFTEAMELQPDRIAVLKRKAARSGHGVHDILLAIFYRQLACLTGQTDLVLGTSVAGRDLPLPDLMRIFGCFATILPIRIAPGDGPWDQEDVWTIAARIAEARSHQLAPRQIARLVGEKASFLRATPMQFLFSFMDFETLQPLTSRYLHIDWTRSRTEMQPPRLGTDLMLTCRVLAGRMHMTFTGNARALDASCLKEIAIGFRNEVERISETKRPRATGSNTSAQSLDAALVAYLPARASLRRALEDFGLSLDPKKVRELAFPDGRPRHLETLTCGLGRSGTIFLPWFADELRDRPPGNLAKEIAAATQNAASLGATCISLAGMLPSLTGYGFRVLELLAGEHSIRLTTGHGLTAVSVVRNLQHALQAAGLRCERVRLAILGLGSIGVAALRLLLLTNRPPKAMILCDLREKESHLRRIQSKLREEWGYRGRVALATGSDRAPDAVYHAEVILGAASKANILDVQRLQPGTVVVDDSFPPCFDQEAAVERMKRVGDVLLVGAGLLDCGQVAREFHLPPGTPLHAEQLLGYLPRVGLPGCQLESLLAAREPSLPLTQGLVSAKGMQAYWEAANRWKLRAARLHLGRYFPDFSQIKLHR